MFYIVLYILSNSKINLIFAKTYFMKPASVPQIRKELRELSQQEVLEICLRLSRFKKENKELLTYLLFDASDEEDYVARIKNYMDNEFKNINTNTYYYIKKSIRKILREIKKHIRFSQNKETEVELLLYFCKKLMAMKPTIKRDKVLFNIYKRQIEFVKKKILLLHEDLQYDFNLHLDEIGINYENI